MPKGERVASDAGGEPTDAGAKCQGEREVQGGRMVNSVKAPPADRSHGRPRWRVVEKGILGEAEK